MHVISTSKKTVLSDFADLETKSEFVHQSGEPRDFQFNGQRRVFVEVDKMAGLTVMRIREKEEKAPEIQRVRKLTIDNAYCVACAKQTPDEIAVGQSGTVKLYNFRSAQLIHRFPADAQRSTVLYMDYNCTDEYIAAVREGGSINIFGTKTKQKMNTFTLDSESTLVRFHPSRRFQLSIASFKGAIYVFDVQSKRMIFNADAHTAPCRDISMCSALPNLLVSVGYDCKINIYDIRKNRAQAATDRLGFSHPLSAVTLSECGTYFCVGNLKGELIAYDTRSTKHPLAVKMVHDGAPVTRVAFVPNPSEENPQNGSLNSSGNVTGVERTHSDELRKSIAANLLSTQQQLANMGYGVSTPAARQQRDSFCDFLDGQGPRAVDRMSTRVASSHRDSFDWDTLNRKPQADTLQRQSLCPAGGSQVHTPDVSVNSSQAESLQQTLSGPLKDRSNISGDVKLMKIAETDEHMEESAVNCSEASTGSDKENPLPMDAEMKQRLQMLSASRNSTPRVENIAPKSSNPMMKPQQLLAKSSSGLSAQADPVEWRREFNDIHENLDETRVFLQQEMSYLSEWHANKILEQMKALSEQHMQNSLDVRDALDLLLRNDKLMKDYRRLQYENEALKAELKYYRDRERTESSEE